jgi:hypothetical protein
LPTKCQLQAGSLSIAFLTSLAFASFLSEVKRTFTNFPMTHHNLESSRAMPSRLGGFTFKSNKCYQDCFTKLKCSQRGSHPTLSLDFSQITQTSLRGEGEMSQRLQKEYFCWWNQQPSKEGRGKLFILPPKTSRWKLASRNQNIRFWNRNIQFLKYSRYRPNQTLQFGNLNIRFFQGLVRGGVYEAIVFHSSHLGFLGYVSIETLLAIHVISLLIERHSYTQDKHKIHFFNLSLHNVDSCHFISL